MPEELNLLPCPACGCQPVTYEVENPRCVGISCKCGLTSPQSYEINGNYPSWDEAITAWNSLPRALTWTTEPPTVVGWYFWRSDTFQGNGYESTVYVDDTKAILELLLTNKHKNIRFAGPIPMPKEPTP